MTSGKTLMRLLIIFALCLTANAALAKNKAFFAFMAGGLQFTEELTEGAAFARTLPKPMLQRIMAAYDTSYPDRSGLYSKVPYLASFHLINPRFMGRKKKNQFELASFKTMNEIAHFGDPNAAIGVILLRDGFWGGLHKPGIVPGAERQFGKAVAELTDSELLWLLAARNNIDFKRDPAGNATEARAVALTWMVAGLIERSDIQQLVEETLALQPLPE